MNQRLTKAERIRRRADYLRIQGGGRKLHTPSFVCFSAGQAGRSSSSPASPPSLNEGDRPPTRLGITVSKRVGGSVVRNRVKRLLREAFRRHKPDFPPGLELVVIARAEAAQVGYGQVERELCELGRRLAGGRVGAGPKRTG